MDSLPSCFNQDPLSAVQEMLALTFTWPLSCAQEHVIGEILLLKQPAQHVLLVRRMQGQRQTN